jgi:hypothetical protein
VGLDAEIAKVMAKEAEKEAAEGAAAAAKAAGNDVPTPEQVKESWKMVAAKALWNFTRTKGLPAFKQVCKWSYAQAKAAGKKSDKPLEKKVKDLRAQDVTVFGTVVDSQMSVTEKNSRQVSFIAEGGGTTVEVLPANEKLVVFERGKIR